MMTVVTIFGIGLIDTISKGKYHSVLFNFIFFYLTTK